MKPLDAVHKNVISTKVWKVEEQMSVKKLDLWPCSNTAGITVGS